MKIPRVLRHILRWSAPLITLVVSVYGFWLIVHVEAALPTPTGAPQKIRTKVKPLVVSDYQVRVKTNGIVQAHNMVTLSAEVAGQIVRLNPVIEVGAYCKTGDTLVEIDDRDYRIALADARAQHKVALASLKLAEANLRRLASLRKQNAVSDMELEEAEAGLTQAEGALERVDVQIEQAERDLDRTKVRAPFDGRIRSKLIGLGQRVGIGTALVEVFSVDYAEVRLPLSNRDLQYLTLPESQSDPPVKVTLQDAVDVKNPTRWEARIERVEGMLDANSLELFAIARIDDPFGLISQHPPLIIGRPVIAMVQGITLNDVVLIPRGAVRQLDRIHFVDQESLRLSSSNISPLWSDDQYAIVRDSTIQTGDLLATTPLVYAPEGSEVEIIPDASLEENSSLVSKNETQR